MACMGTWRDSLPGIFDTMFVSEMGQKRRTVAPSRNGNGAVDTARTVTLGGGEAKHTDTQHNGWSCLKPRTHTHTHARTRALVPTRGGEARTTCWVLTRQFRRMEQRVRPVAWYQRACTQTSLLFLGAGDT